MNTYTTSIFCQHRSVHETPKLSDFPTSRISGMPPLLQRTEIHLEEPYSMITVSTDTCREVVTGVITTASPKMSIAENYAGKCFVRIDIKDANGAPSSNGIALVKMLLSSVYGIGCQQVEVTYDTVSIMFLASYMLDPVAISSILMVVRVLSLVNRRDDVLEPQFQSNAELSISRFAEMYISTKGRLTSELGGGYYGASDYHMSALFVMLHMLSTDYYTGTRSSSTSLSGDGPGSKMMGTVLPRYQTEQAIRRMSDVELKYVHTNFMPVSDKLNQNVLQPLIEEVKRRQL